MSVTRSLRLQQRGQFVQGHPSLSDEHLQAVHELYDIVDGPAWSREEPRCTRIVVIGRNLSRPMLEATLMQSIRDAA